MRGAIFAPQILIDERDLWRVDVKTLDVMAGLRRGKPRTVMAVENLVRVAVIRGLVFGSNVGREV